SLRRRRGVVLAGPETWLPASLAASLKAFVRHGGGVLSLGAGALRGVSHISNFPANPVAGAPTESKPDLFGATHGPIAATMGLGVVTLGDQLGLFGDVPAVQGFSQYELIQPPAGVPTATAGVASGDPAVTAFKLGRGYVAEVGLVNFNMSLASNTRAQELLTGLWQLLSK
ncbi:MAG TPA: hypothetical protein VME01_09100, partial [Solirubrobacteraceae bacterium]|nr:hypothetical protein [Solirubrobacteraceae bacterium]